MQKKAEVHKEICKELNELYKTKNKDYGDSFSKLYHKFGIKSTIIRLYDKLYRLETLMKQDREVEDESVEDSLKDLANYAILTLIEERIEDND